MKANVAYLENKFKYYNELMFGGLLKPVPIGLADVSSYMGRCNFTTKRLPDGRVHKTAFNMVFNTRIDISEEELDDTLIHEMIHYFIGCHQLIDTGPHGHIFKSVMESLNSTYGRHITVSARLDRDQKEQQRGTARKWHIVAIVRLKDGRTGIKVLPLVAEKAAAYYKTIYHKAFVRTVELYLHDDPYFNRFPCSSATNIFEADACELEQAMRGAKRLYVKGNTVFSEDDVSGRTLR